MTRRSDSSRTFVEQKRWQDAYTSLIDVVFVETQITARNLAEVCLETTLTKFCVAKFNHLLHPSVHKQQLGTFSCYQRRIKLVVQERTVRYFNYWKFKNLRKSNAVHPEVSVCCFKLLFDAAAAFKFLFNGSKKNC